ncbi:MAG TPA: DUF952 domain-containing protein [Mycobacteriales bacterium]|nr:DUF952 domain-containing protein [Mycobacteriales bacterium]
MATRSVIFHITEPDIWAKAAEAGRFTGSTRDQSLDDVGFIHCSYEDQVEMIANFVYPDWDEELVLLEIDPARIGVDLKVESAIEAGPMFPHIYGPLPTAAVTAVHPLVRNDGRWVLPQPSA